MAAAEECRERLLKREEIYYMDCPGCKMEQLKLSESGLPLKKLVSLWTIVLCTALPITSLFPFLYFMIRDFHIVKREENIGFYAGFIGASFMFGRVLTSVLWGVVADKYGRKPVIILGLMSVVIFNTLFGLSVNFWMAIVTRILLGALNGSLGPLRAYAAEIFTEEYHALGMSTVSTAWSIGLIIGPAMGGFLAQPADNYPTIFSRESIFGRFPYFLPCLCISFFAAGVTISSFWLPESLHIHNDKSKPLPDSHASLEVGSCDSSAKEDIKKNEASEGLFKNWPLMSSIIVNCAFSLHDMAYSEIFSLWAVSPRKFGGLSYSTEDVGQVLAITGLGILVFQSTLYPRVVKFLGTIQVARFAAVLSIPVLATYPYLAMLSGLNLTLLLNCASVAKNVFTVSIITSLLILQNEAVEQHQRGAAMGISMTAMSIFKAAGPATGGIILSWAQKRQNAAFLPGDQMVFFILNVVLAIVVLFTFRPFLVKRRDE